MQPRNDHLLQPVPLRTDQHQDVATVSIQLKEMSSLFEMPIATETLSAEELNAITGAVAGRSQLEWLNRHGWVYLTTKSGSPVVGRLYARLKLAGINPASLTTGGWSPDFSNVK